MANPYKYSQQDYANALNRYNQSVAAHNRKIDEYNKTLAFDAQGRTLVKDKFNNTVFAVESDGKLVKSALPEGTTMTDYNYSALPDSDRYMLVRQGTPSEQINRSVLDPNKNPYSSSDPYLRYVESVYQQKPEDFQMAVPTAPRNPTVSQLRRLANSSDPLAAERGLVSEVIASKGLR